MAYEVFTVLLVDDDPVVVKLYDKSLRELHYRVVVASGGQEALEKAFAEPPDVVLLDIMMPDMDGYQVCARLRAAPLTADVPIMILTALHGAAARQKAADIGADDFVTKGEPVSNVEGRIKMLIKRRILARTQSWLADLPGSVAADNALLSRLRRGLPMAVCYFDLDDLGALNARAGVREGERVLWKLARVLLAHAGEGEAGDFIGYYGRDDFVVLTVPDRAEQLAGAVVDSFDRAMREWSGGERGLFPTLSAAVIIIERGSTVRLGQVSGLGDELLRQAKEQEGSAVRVARL